MSTAKQHTPGPWAIRPQNYGQAVEGPLRESVAWCGDNFSSLTGNVPFVANANLIAAAPDLLAALEQIMMFGGGCCCPQAGSTPNLHSQTCREARAAIAKARGQNDA